MKNKIRFGMNTIFLLTAIIGGVLSYYAGKNDYITHDELYRGGYWNGSAVGYLKGCDETKKLWKETDTNSYNNFFMKNYPERELAPDEKFLESMTHTQDKNWRREVYTDYFGTGELRGDEYWGGKRWWETDNRNK